MNLYSMLKENESGDTQEAEMGIKKHQARVKELIDAIIEELQQRAATHDDSKFDDEERDTYLNLIPKIYGEAETTDEERAELKIAAQPAIDHHYAVNRHHPEFHEAGVDGMTLVDLIEMVCDWKAASERGGNNLMANMDNNQNRFRLTGQLRSVIENTIKTF